MKKKTVLLVDDEEVIRFTLGRDLEEAGYAVTRVADGKEGLSRLRKRHVDLVITDLLMEGMDGIEVLRACKEIDPEVCVVILTGFGDLSSAIDAVRHGADDYLLKPYDFDDLVLRLSRCLERRELQKKVQAYEEILPVCCICKKIRDDAGKEHGAGDWLTVEEYSAKRRGPLPRIRIAPLA